MDKKKIAAAMAAVTAFIKTGEAAANPYPPPIDGAVMPAFQMNLWGISGRQAVMQAGSMMQLRMFK